MTIKVARQRRLSDASRKALLCVTLFSAVLLLTVGCAKLTASVPAGTDLAKLKSFYVVRHEADGRGVNELIRDDLTARGMTATTGPESARPTTVDTIVTYEDRWMWDITMYMLSLNISFRDGTSNALLASGQSYRPSLERKEPSYVVKEVLDEIFKAEK
jgi:hypothetical protein